MIPLINCKTKGGKVWLLNKNSRSFAGRFDILYSYKDLIPSHIHKLQLGIFLGVVFEQERRIEQRHPAFA
jgi:hypothetical protein